ncbi:hypothetical protein [methane-oxidizing endosymbiont of Gigantopelta aegis]|uniref:hypothetical protein n=1 Tax=methane-oxidizing endosymbiont of Gigantopelta aegis TaxID=2794938 RepID=UPI0018DB8984|nr:hypothetical protein [methane-oxidizing endosymbiont of Gigantopelta aegis]
MLNKISQFLFGKKNEVTRLDKTKKELPHKQEKLSYAHTSNAVDSFLFSIKGVGHLEYPILDKHYSPSSRVPCTDLVPFISERLIVGDIASVKTIMRLVIEGNPGLGIGPEWIDEGIDDILSIPFGKYVSFKSENGIYELKALFIVAAKGGGGREFLITEEIPRLISWACIAHQPSWSTQLHSLAKKANSWIAKMAKDTPYWQEYERFYVRELPNASIETDLRAVILTLTPAARLQLFYAVEREGGALSSLTNYQIRSLGINVEQTSKELIESGLVLHSSSKEAIESAHSKQELVDLCETYGATYRKSWKKEKLVEALEKIDSAVLEKIAKSKNLVSPNYQRYPDLRNVVRIADEHQVGFKLLCFA